jgi:hypothetical protein
MTAFLGYNSAALGVLTDAPRIGAGIALILGIVCLGWAALSDLGFARIWIGRLGKRGQSIVLLVAGSLFLAVFLEDVRAPAMSAAAERCHISLRLARSKLDSMDILDKVPDSTLGYGRRRWYRSMKPRVPYTCREVLGRVR